METTRTTALEYWRSLTILKRNALTSKYFLGRIDYTLTGREIEKIWQYEYIKT